MAGVLQALFSQPIGQRKLLMSLLEKNRGRRSWDCFFLQFQRLFFHRLMSNFLWPMGFENRTRKTLANSHSPCACTFLEKNQKVYQERVLIFAQAHEQYLWALKKRTRKTLATAPALFWKRPKKFIRSPQLACILWVSCAHVAHVLHTCLKKDCKKKKT